MILGLPRGMAPEAAPPARGHHIASIGLDRLEATLYERDCLREKAAHEHTCEACKDGLHRACVRRLSEAAHPPLPMLPCSCPDCALGIPEAAEYLATTWESPGGIE